MSNSIPESFEYQLEQPFKVTHDKVEDFCTAIKIEPPTHRQKDDVLFLTQSLAKAFMEQARGLVDQEREAPRSNAPMDLKGHDLLMALLASSVDVRSVEKVFKKLILTQGTSLMPMSMAPIERHYNLISIKDCQNLLGEYLVNFILSSVIPNS